MSVQSYETDALQEHVDSTSLLISRLDQWRHAVHVVQQYAHGYLQLHQGVTTNLEKTQKSINDIPTFSGTVGKEDNGSQLALVFKNMQSNVNVLLQRSSATANGIKTTVLPGLEDVVVEIDKHYKSLKTQGAKGIKEVDKTREHTQKQVEQLAQVTSSYGARTLSPHEDPLVIHRKAEAAVADQISRENIQAEAALNVQQSFGSLEAHVMQAINQALSGLAALNEGFDKVEYEVNSTITDSFKSVDIGKEWNIFSQANSNTMVPTKNFKRDPRVVTFANKNHASTRPVLEGILNRKGTVLKSYNQGYYIISPSGYLYQFKSPDPTQDLTPELSLYLPGCQVSKSSRPGDFVFKVVGKDSKKAISTRHKYVFRANSQGELDAWFNAVARMSGNVAPTDANDDDSAEGDLASPTETPGQSPIEPPTQQFANTSLDNRGAVPQAQTQVPHTQVPTSADQGPHAIPLSQTAPHQASGGVPSGLSGGVPTSGVTSGASGVPSGVHIPGTPENVPSAAHGTDPFKGF